MWLLNIRLLATNGYLNSEQTTEYYISCIQIRNCEKRKGLQLLNTITMGSCFQTSWRDTDRDIYVIGKDKLLYS